MYRATTFLLTLVVTLQQRGKKAWRALRDQSRKKPVCFSMSKFKSQHNVLICHLLFFTTSTAVLLRNLVWYPGCRERPSPFQPHPSCSSSLSLSKETNSLQCPAYRGFCTFNSMTQSNLINSQETVLCVWTLQNSGQEARQKELATWVKWLIFSRIFLELFSLNITIKMSRKNNWGIQQPLENCISSVLVLVILF